MTTPTPSSVLERGTAALAWLGPWLSVGALALWSSGAGPVPLAVAAAGFVAGLLRHEVPGRVRAVGMLVLTAGILAGFVAQRQVWGVRQDWNGYWQAREHSVGQRLSGELDRILGAAETAADELAATVGEKGSVAHREVAALRTRHGLTALAVYDADGQALVWDGTHRGKVPDGAKRGLRRYLYRERPLFGYLYVTSDVGLGRGNVVAAVLMRTDLPAAEVGDAGDFVSDFERRVGERLRISRPGALHVVDGVWDLKLGDEVLFSVSLEEPDPETRVAEVLSRWQTGVALLTLLAWVFLAVGAPSRPAGGVAAAAALVLVAALVPLGRIAPLASLFDPGTYQLPGPLPLTLGRLAAVSMAWVAVMGLLPRVRRRARYWVSGAVVAVGLPALALWLHAGATVPSLAAGDMPWVVYQGTMAWLMALLIGAALTVGGRGRASDATRFQGFAALGLALALGAAMEILTRITGQSWTWMLPLWGVSVAMAARSIPVWPAWQRPLAIWLASAVIGASGAIPTAWGHRVEAEKAVGAQKLKTLADGRDRDLEIMLGRLGPLADSLDRVGAAPVQILYGMWTGSGLAHDGRPVRLTYWTAGGLPEPELRVGVRQERPAVLIRGAEEARGTTTPHLLRFARADARYVVQVPLTADRVVSVAVPSGSEVTSPSPLQPLFAGVPAGAADPLSLIPLEKGDPREGAPLRWNRVAEGWQGELSLEYSDAVYQAHYLVELPGPLLVAARGMVFVLLNAGLFLLLWAMGSMMSRQIRPREMRWSELVISFRARVTLALFGFFVLANAIFGTLAYRTIAGAAQRTARVIAERVVEDAAGWYQPSGGAVTLLAERVGVGLLEYRNGELREGSVEELVELGLYEGWLPYAVEERLGSREGVREFTVTSLGRWEYVTAYRWLPDGDVLAVQIPLQAGATAIRSRDVLDLLAFALALGGVLSLGLAFLVARALTRPIQSLQVASERVGAGNLGLRLPEDRGDEFGAVFAAFNRMVGRLRQARRQLVRTTRRTQAIMEETATGMIALDPSGRVIMANPRAEEILGAAADVGAPVPCRSEAGQELAVWVQGFLSGADEEDAVDLASGERRIRVRARRIHQQDTPGGAVISLEDVTDELRAERVLAWGEMARQVAHEVKNPLTPIKLSVQHIRRAWKDQRPEFDEILTRNADAMLAEIDRLAAIAQSFSRFGAPGQRLPAPLEAVDLGSVIDEILALYRGPDGPIRYVKDVRGDPPPVRARRDEMKEVLVNLLENARTAVAGGGEILIMVRAGDESVELVVADDGDGIPDDVLPRVFEPHFSTRSTGGGLGLAIVRSLAESWGGDVSLESEKGRGTRIHVRLDPWNGEAPVPGAGDGVGDPAS